MNGGDTTYLGLPLEFWFSGPFGIPFHIWTLTVTITGLMVGSFLNVVIHRMPLDQSVVTPPSHCPKPRPVPMWRPWPAKRGATASTMY